jgi:MFS family permease
VAPGMRLLRVLRIEGEASPLQEGGALSSWSPLRRPLFRTLWIAALASNVGAWIQDVGSAWLMTSLAPSPIMVSLLQTAASLPFFLLALPAGAVADIMDRRRVLLVAQGWMLGAAALLGVLTLLGRTTPWILLVLVFAYGLGAAVNLPAWQAIMPDLVPSREMPSAVTLSSITINLSRAIGPAMGGFLVAAAGSGPAFLVNAASFLGMLWVLARWKKPPRKSVLPAERVFGAVRAGVRYARHSPDLRNVFVRTGIFIFFGSALWALLPLLARRELGLDASGYGLLLGCLGAGAVLGAGVLGRIRRKVPLNALVAFMTVVYAAVLVALSLLRVVGWLYPVMVAAGVAWIWLMLSFNISVQSAVPEWVRARGLSLYLLMFMGGMAVGSTFWGLVAARAGMAFAFLCSGVGLLLSLAAAGRFRLPRERLDLTPSMHWSVPAPASDPQLDSGPVLVTIEYRVDPGKADEFAQAMQELGRVRRRDGAAFWGLYRDLSDPRRHVETFIVESWAEHVRQHGRATVEDRRVQERILAFHSGDGPPAVSHCIAEPRAA